jgi:hypothetical protein
METMPTLSPREELIEYLNFKQYNMREISTKDIIEEFRERKQIQIPTSTAYRIVKKWNEEQEKIKQQSLSAQVCDELLTVFNE